MFKWKPAATLVLTLAFSLSGCGAYLAGNSHPAPVAAKRLLIFSPHPDDETLGCAGLIQIAIQQKSQVEVVFFTNGDAYTADAALVLPNIPAGPARMQALGSLRQAEARKADQILGVPADNVSFLGYPDNGLMHLWQDYWDPSHPYTSPSTGQNKVTAPAFDPGAPYAGASVVADVERIIDQFNPTDVYYTDPNEANTDHLAAGYFVKYALLASGKSIADHSFIIHHNGSDGADWPPFPWKVPQDTTSLPPPASLTGIGVTWQTLPLTTPEIQLKEKAYQAYRSQVAIGPKLFNAFARKNELFANNPVQTLVPATGLSFFPSQAHWTKEEIRPGVAPEDNLTAVSAAPSGSYLGLGLQARNTLNANHTNIWYAFLFGPQGTTPARLVVYVKGAQSFAQENGITLDSRFIRSGSQEWVWVKLSPGTNFHELYLGAEVLNGRRQLDVSAWREWRP